MADGTLLLDIMRGKLPYSAKEARASGSTFYYTGIPCRHGHVARRYTGNQACETCHRKYVYRAPTDKMRAREREHYHKNRDAHRVQQTEYRRLRTLGQPWWRMLHSAKKRAEKRNIPFDLTPEWAKANWTGRCALSNIEFSPNKRRGGLGYSPSIDKIDASLGYVQTNCRFILHCINSFRGTMSDKEMLSVAKILSTFCEEVALRPLLANDLYGSDLLGP